MREEVRELSAIQQEILQRKASSVSRLWRSSSKGVDSSTTHRNLSPGANSEASSNSPKQNYRGGHFDHPGCSIPPVHEHHSRGAPEPSNSHGSNLQRIGPASDAS